MGHEEELHEVSLNPLDEIKLPVQELMPRTKGHEDRASNWDKGTQAGFISWLVFLCQFNSCFSPGS